MRRMIDNDYLTMAVRVVVGVVFVSASVYKIIDPGSFARSIWYYHLMPGSLINLIALVLPWVELLADDVDGSALQPLILDGALLLLILQLWFSRSRRWMCSRK